jgi:hypothetical protein
MVGCAPPSSLAITSTLPSCFTSVTLQRDTGAEDTYSGGVGNRAVRVAKGQADSNPLCGVVLRAHGWRGCRLFARSWGVGKITDTKAERL